MSASDILGAVAREVVEFYGDRIDGHPVGTGPFKLAQWRRSSFIALERNPDFREMVFDGEPAADDAEGQAILARFKGRRLPMVDRVEISIIEEEQPRWLSFLNGDADLAYRVGYQFVTSAMPNGKVAPYLAKRGIQGFRIVEPSIHQVLFNMEDPVVGGYTPDKVALRRAIGLGCDVVTEINHAWGGQGVVAQQPVPALHHRLRPEGASSEMSHYDPARAKALLDMYGYVDRDGDGWRDMPDGQPLMLPMAAQTDGRTRKINELLQKNMTALGLRIDLPHRPVAREPEGGARRQAVAVDGGPLRGRARRRVFAAALRQQADRRPEHGALQDARSRRVVPAHPGAARRPRARSVVRAGAETGRSPTCPTRCASHRVSTDMAQPWLIGY